MNAQQFIVYWNNKFPKDRFFRKKYNLAFGSSEHRSMNQIDIYFDQLEDKLFDKHIELYEEREKRLETYRVTGKWLKEHQVDDKDYDDLFDKIDVSQFNKNKE